jgi:hypothetical protein
MHKKNKKPQNYRTFKDKYVGRYKLINDRITW